MKSQKTVFYLVTAILGSGIVMAILLLSGVLTVNITPSVPVGLWYIAKSAKISKETYVQVDIEAFSEIERWRDFPFPRNALGKRMPFIKKVVGLPGDRITCVDKYVFVNGEKIPDSQIYSKNRNGLDLVKFVFPVVLKNGEVWLSSEHSKGLDSRYLGTVRMEMCRKAVPLITWN